MSDRATTEAALCDTITSYLANGGLWNPELMDHEKVKTLLMDCREYLALHAAPPVAADETCPDCNGKGGEDKYLPDDPTNKLMHGPHWYSCQTCEGSGKVRPVAADIAEAKSVLSKMTLGKWHSPAPYYGCNESLVNGIFNDDDGAPDMLLGEMESPNDAFGIAYLRNKAESWLDELARLRAAAKEPHHAD